MRYGFGPYIPSELERLERERLERERIEQLMHLGNALLGGARLGPTALPDARGTVSVIECGPNQKPVGTGFAFSIPLEGDDGLTRSADALRLHGPIKSGQDKKESTSLLDQCDSRRQAKRTVPSTITRASQGGSNSWASTSVTR